MCWLVIENSGCIPNSGDGVGRAVSHQKACFVKTQLRACTRIQSASIILFVRVCLFLPLLKQCPHSVLSACKTLPAHLQRCCCHQENISSGIYGAKCKNSLIKIPISCAVKVILRRPEIPLLLYIILAKAAFCPWAVFNGLWKTIELLTFGHKN